MLMRMVGQGLVAAAIVAALSYGYQTYREAQLEASFASSQDAPE